VSPRSQLAPVALVGALLAGLVGAGCTSAVDDPGPAAPDALSWTDSAVDLEGVPLAVGSKEPAQQRLLGWIAAEALRAAGADVTDEINLGGTGANREALLAGFIDLYWEYTGVGWGPILERADPETDPTGLYEDVRERDLEENDIVWLDPAPAQLGFGFVASPEVAADLELDSTDDLAAAIDESPDEVSICIGEQDSFDTDPEGLARFEAAAGVSVPEERLVEVPAADLYEALDTGFCTVVATPLGDPRIAEAEAVTLEDDGVFVPWQAAVTVRDDVLADAPDIAEVLDPVSERLTTDVLRWLTGRVELDGETPRDVARTWLVSTGLAADPDGVEDSS
jgi:osmoprotectant transport system substrate-binding protein